MHVNNSNNIVKWFKRGNGGRITRNIVGRCRTSHPSISLGMGTTNALLDVVSLVTHLSQSSCNNNIDFDDNAQVAAAISAYESERITATTPLFYKAREGETNPHSDRHADDLKVAFDKARGEARRK